MNETIRAFAAPAPGVPLKPFEYRPGPLGDEQVEIQVTHCGICHSDISMLDNAWGQTTYPFVPGHEAVGRVVARGRHVKGLELGQRVGVGWFSGSCQHCPQCLAGHANLCAAAEQTIVGRHGGFADRLRCHWLWASPLPETLDLAVAGPLFCAGITVFTPLVHFQVRPTDRAGVVGIGGLGHLAVQFLNKWGCEVTAFTSHEDKRDEVLRLGAHRVVNTRNAADLARLRGSLDFLLVTVNVPLDWTALLDTLAPRGRLHVVGAVLEPMPVAAFSLLVGQKSLSGSPVGDPATVGKMLEFCARHRIVPQVEEFPLSLVNDALAHLRAGRARYRLVLRNDFAA